MLQLHVDTSLAQYFPPTPQSKLSRIDYTPKFDILIKFPYTVDLMWTHKKNLILITEYTI